MEQPAPAAMPHSDSDELAAFWGAVVERGDVHEVRAPKTRKGPRRWYGVVSGYFDDCDEFLDALEGTSGRDAEGIYLTLNPVNPALKARAANRLQDGRPVTTQDMDILRRKHILIDIDPVRPAGISATAEEQAAALRTRDAIAEALTALGWPAAVVSMESGNGGALVYRVSLDNDQAATRLVERVLKGLAAAFDSPAVTVDTATANAARIFKIAGTVAAKGDHMPDRPWRMANAAYATDAAVVPGAMLEAVAAWGEEAAAQPTPIRPGVERWERRDIRGALTRAGVGFSEKPKSYGTVFELDRCLTSTDHTDGAVVIEMASGALAYRCMHNRCMGKGWAVVREELGFGGDAGDPGPRLVVGGIDLTTGEILEPAIVAAPEADEEPDQHQTEYPEPPRECFFGWFGEYLDLVEPTTEASDAFHLGVALTIVGAMIGRNAAVNYSSSNLYPNLYAVLVGASGYSRKDTAIQRFLKITDLNLSALDGGRLLNRAFGLVYDVSSAQGLITDLSENENLLLYISEFSSLIRNARRQSTSTILPALMQAYNGMPLQNNVKQVSERRRVEAPCLSMLAATQPEVLSEDMTGQDIASGFANRVLWFPGQGKEARPRPPALDKQAAWSLYERLFFHIEQQYPAGSVLPLHEDTKELWDDWYRRDREMKGKNPDEDSMRVRHPEYIHKIALQFAVVDGSKEVRARHMEPAIRLLDWEWHAVRTLMTEWGKGTFSIIEDRIKAVLRKYGPQPRRMLQMRCKDRRWSSVEFSQVFKAMRENRSIVEAADGTVTLPGRAR